MRKNYKDISVSSFNQFLMSEKLIRKILLFLLFTVFSLNASAQNCNLEVPTPFIESTFGNLTATDDVNGICVLCSGLFESRLIDNDLTNYATASIPVGVAGSVSFKVKDETKDHPAGSYVGYRIDTSVGVSLNVVNSITLRTYLNGSLQETVLGADLLGLGLLNVSGPRIVGFNTTKSFDAIEISVGSVVGLLNTVNVYYPVIRDYCKGPDLSCNSVTAMNLPAYPVSIEPSHTGLSGINLGSISDADNAISSSSTDYATINMTLGVAATGSISVKDQITDYPVGTYAGFEIENSKLLSVDALGSVLVKTYLNGVLQEQSSGSNPAVGAGLLNSSGRAKVGFVSTKAFDEVQLSLYQTVSLNLGTTKVFGAVFEKFCAGPDLVCNTSTSMSAPDYPVYVNSTNTGIEGLACPACVVNDAESIISKSSTDYASIVMTAGIASTGNISVKDQIIDYPAGTYAGFEIENAGLLSVSALSNVTIRTYLNGVVKEQFSGGNLAVGAGLLNSSGRSKLGFVTTKAFDEIQLSLNQTVSLNLGTTKVFGAVFEKFCAGPVLVCNTPTSMSAPNYPVYINSLNSGIEGVACPACAINDSENVISSSTTDYASIVMTLGVAATGSISVKDQITDYPIGTYAGFEFENSNLASVSALSNVTIRTYLNGVSQEQFSGSDLAVGAALLNASGRSKLGFVSTKAFDEVRLSLNQTVSLNLGTTKVYAAIFEKFCAGPDLVCNVQTQMLAPEYPVYINSVNTGIDGLVCALCSVNNTENLIDHNATNYAQINLTASVGNSASISVKDQIVDYPAGSYAGFTIENPSLLSVNALDAIMVRTYLNGNLQETKSGKTGLVAVNTGLLVASGLRNIGFVSTKPFDEVRITLVNTATVTLGVVNVYNAIFQKLCDPVIICNKTYAITNPTFPAVIDSGKTGVDGVACVACAVNNANNVLTEDTTDFASVKVTVGVLNTASIAVLDQKSTFPAGTRAGFTIKDLKSLIQLDLFNSLTISTYLDGALAEVKNGSQLINLNLLTSIFGSGPGIYNVGFKTTKAFDEVRITVGSLASVINDINIYGAFIDTNGASGGTLHCAIIDAVDDNIPSINGFSGNANAGNVLSNDTLNGIPVLISEVDLTVLTAATALFSGAPVPTINVTNGVVNIPAGTPSGNYTIKYQICEKINPTNCDSATVTIAVQAPVIDAVNDNISSINGFVGNVNAGNVLTNDTLSGNLVSINAINVSVLTAATAVFFGAPVPAINVATGVVNIPAGTPAGNYTIRYQICEKINPTNCDSAIVTIVVQAPVIDAVNDTNTNIVYGQTGGNTGINVFNNDTLNSNPIIPSNVVLTSTPNGPLTINPDGTVTVAPHTTGGTYTVNYTICEKLNPTNCDTATVTVFVSTPGIALVKTGAVNGTGISGDTITYTFTVTNTGNTALTNVLVNDPLTGSVNLAVSPSTLQPNQTGTATATYVLKQADVNAGKVTNSATVTAKDPNNNNVTDTSGTTINTDDPTVTVLTLNSTIALVKTGSVNGTGKAGDTITYTFTVTNTGNTTLNTVLVNDSLTGSVNLPVTPSILQPNQTGTATATYVITQSDVDLGKVTNSATVSAKDPKGNNVIDTSGTTITTNDPTVTVLTPTSSIALVKTGAVNGTGKSGDTITYTFTVTNTGNTTLTNILVNDPLTGSGNLVVSPNFLQPNQTGIVIATYVIRQSDVDVGKVTNTAKVTAKDPNNNNVTDTSGTTISNDDPTVTTLTPTSTIALVKAGSVNGAGKTGDTITYTFTVTNTGNTTLSSVFVNDALTGSVDLVVNPSVLQPNQTGTATATYVIKQSDVDLGKVTNTATVTAKDPNNNNVTDISGTTILNNDPTVTTLTPTSTIALVKTGTVTGIIKAGDTITYTFTVTNTGNTTLSNVSINDPLMGSAILTVTPSVLQPNQTGTAKATYVIKQSDIDLGKVTNTATVTAKDPNNNNVIDISGTTITNDDPTETTLVQKSSIVVVKTGAVNGTGKAGDTISYTFTVTNTGNTTLTNIFIKDPLLSSGNLVVIPDFLQPNQTGTVTATYTIKQSDVDLGQVTNTAIVSGTDPKNVVVTDKSGTTITNDDPTVTTLTLNPSIALVKTGVVNGAGKSGDTITYTFKVTNTGNTTLNNILVNDPLTASVNLAVVPSILQPNQTGTATATYIIKQSDVDTGKVTNTAIVSAKDPNNNNITDISGSTIITNDPTVTVLTPTSSIALVKTGAVNGAGKAGDTITYTFTVTNTGNMTLSNILVNDLLTGSVNLAVVPSVLQPNQTGIATATYIIKQSDVDLGKVINSATVTAKDPNNNNVMDISGTTIATDDSTVTVLILNPSIALVKTSAVNGTGLSGDTITYTFTVTNTGNTTLTNILINDPLTESIDLAVNPSILQPNQTGTATATYVVMQSDVDLGKVTNTAIVSAKDPNNNSVTDISGTTITTDDSTVTILTQKSSIALVKAGVVNGKGKSGDTITYTFTVTNTGNTTLTNILVNDPLTGSVNLAVTPSVLAPNEIGTATAAYVIDQSDVDLGKVTNTATVSAKDPNNNDIIDISGTTITTDDATVTVLTPTSSIALIKTGAMQETGKSGDTITYTFKVINTGITTLTNVLVNDPLIGSASLEVTPSILQPNEIGTATATYIIKQSDVDSGKVTNTAVVIAKDPNGNNVTDISGTTISTDDTTVVVFIKNPSISITKEDVFEDTNNNGIANEGDLVKYTFVVTNTGNETLTNIVVTDDNAVVSGGPLATLGVGESDSTTFVATHTITQADIEAGYVYNIALVTAQTTDGGNISIVSTDPTPCATCPVNPDCPTCTITLIPQSPSIALIKTGEFDDTNGNGIVEVGERIIYSFEVVNTGNCALSNITISDEKAGITMTGGPIDLPIGGSDSTTFKAVYTLTAADLVAGSVTNTAIVNGTSPLGVNVSDISDDNNLLEDDNTVVVLGTCTIRPFNAVSPDGDGLNDFFRIVGIECYPNNRVEIYNRWGIKVFEQKGYDNARIVFNGISEGRDTVAQSDGLPSGTYFYVIKYVNFDGRELDKSGYLMLSND